MQKFYSVPFMGFNIINHSKMVIAPWGAYGYLRVEHFLHQIFAPSYFFFVCKAATCNNRGLLRKS